MPRETNLPTSRRLDSATHLVTSVPALAQCGLETAARDQALRRVRACSVDRFNSFSRIPASLSLRESCLHEMCTGSLGGGRRLAQARLLRPDWGLGSRMIATQHTVSQIYGEDLNLLLGPGCALRLPLALTDLFAEVRNLVGDVGSRFFTAGRCD